MSTPAESPPRPWRTCLDVEGQDAGHYRDCARNFQVVAALALEGRFQYVERGLLDVTHLRFFTFDEILAIADEDRGQR